LSRAIGRGLRGGWTLLAKGVGGLARTVGRTKDLDPAHRRDGLAFGLIAVGVIAGAGIWWHAAGPVGTWLEFGARSVVGAAAMALPMVVLVIGITLMRSDPQPEKRPRLVIGTLLFVMAFLGILHLFADLPEDNDGRMYAGGALGYVSGGMLAKGVTPWVAIPLLVLVLGFGVLVFTGTPVREIPHRLRHWGLDEEELAEAEAQRSTRRASSSRARRRTRRPRRRSCAGPRAAARPRWPTRRPRSRPASTTCPRRPSRLPRRRASGRSPSRSRRPSRPRTPASSRSPASSTATTRCPTPTCSRAATRRSPAAAPTTP
jgi:S-DNA-T family DNA segregation ATPase FtsK/SpoIIIE